MSVFKTLNSQDIIVSPLELNKSFILSSSAQLISEGITRYTASNQKNDVIYHSIKQLYYSNYISGSDGEISNASTASINLDNTYTGEVYSTLYNNYLNTNLNPQRNLPTSSEQKIAIISLPKQLYGDNIKPKSVKISTTNETYYDDGEGRLYRIIGTDGENNGVYEEGEYEISNYEEGTTLYNYTLINNVFSGGVYGISVYGNTVPSYKITSISNLYGLGIYGFSSYGKPSILYCGNIIYEHGIISLTQDSPENIYKFANDSETNISFSSSLNIYETQYKCEIEEDEFNYTFNPSIISSSSDNIIKNYSTSSYFSPYITTVGLYNENKELLAIAKLAQPIPKSKITNTTILVNIDKF